MGGVFLNMLLQDCQEEQDLLFWFVVVSSWLMLDICFSSEVCFAYFPPGEEWLESYSFCLVFAFTLVYLINIYNTVMSGGPCWAGSYVLNAVQASRKPEPTNFNPNTYHFGTM